MMRRRRPRLKTTSRVTDKENAGDSMSVSSLLSSDHNHLLSSERAALGKASLSSGRLAQDGGAGSANDDGLGVREDRGDVEAARALNVHEERPGNGHKGLAPSQRVRFSRW